MEVGTPRVKGIVRITVLPLDDTSLACEEQTGQLSSSKIFYLLSAEPRLGPCATSSSLVTSGLGPRAECSQALRYLYLLHASPRGHLPCSLARGAGSVISVQHAGRWSGKGRKELGREGKEGPSSWEFQVWKNCWSICVLREPLAVSVRLTNSWVTCRVREPPASRCWVPRVSPSAREEIGRAMCSSLPLCTGSAFPESGSPALGDSPMRKGSVVVL